MTYPPMTLVQVTWVDASDPPGEASWYSEKDVQDFSEDIVRVKTIGYVKSHTKLYLTLVGDYIVNKDGTTTWGRPTKVPFGMVEKVEVLVGEIKEGADSLN